MPEASCLLFSTVLDWNRIPSEILWKKSREKLTIFTFCWD